MDERVDARWTATLRIGAGGPGNRRPGYPCTVAPCASTPTTRWPDGPSSATSDAARVTRLDVCDAHPELLRAARHVGEPATARVPGVSARHVRYVSYVYGDQLRQANGRCIVHPSELERLGAAHDEFARYVVEVCPDCGWNFLTRRELHGRRHGARHRGGGAVRAGTVGAAVRRAGAVPASASTRRARSRLRTRFESYAAGSRGCPGRWRTDEMAASQAARRALGAPDVVARKGPAHRS